MKVYRLFLSHTGNDGLLAKAIATNLNNAFAGAVDVFLAQEDIALGSRWKEDILRNLKECDGIISLITKQSFDKPWLVIEWTAFWMQEPSKDIFILLGDGVSSKSLVSPMVDRQVGVVTNADHLRSLMRTLSPKAGVAKIPFAAVPSMLADINEALRQQEEMDYDRYQKDLSRLPDDDTEKAKIAAHFLERGDLPLVGRILDQMTLDYAKVSIAVNLVAKGRIADAQVVASHIRTARNIGEVVLFLISRGHEDVRVFQDLLDQIGYRDDSEFTQICVEVSKIGKEQSELFANVSNRMNNMAELRKVVMQLVDAGKQERPIFFDILRRFADRNRVELRKVGEHLLQSGRPCESQLTTVLDLLRQHNQEQFNMLAEKVRDKAPGVLDQFLRTHSGQQNKAPEATR